MYLNYLHHFLLNNWLTNLKEKKITNKVKENIKTSGTVLQKQHFEGLYS